MWSLPKQTVNSVVANLIKNGFIFLETVPGTHNRKIIRLTEAGKNYGENVVKYTYKAEQNAFAKMSEQERETFITLVQKYIMLLQNEIREK